LTTKTEIQKYRNTEIQKYRNTFKSTGEILYQKPLRDVPNNAPLLKHRIKYAD